MSEQVRAKDSSVYSSIPDEPTSKGEMRGPDFSMLPDLPWLVVATFLTLQDRFSLSQSCHRVDTIFNTNSQWKCTTLKLTEGGQFTESLQPWQLSFVEMFGHQVEELTVETSNTFFDRRTLSTLLSIQHFFNLKKLNLKMRLNVPLSTRNSTMSLAHSHIYNVITAVSNTNSQCDVSLDLCYDVAPTIPFYLCSPSDQISKHTRSLEIKLTSSSAEHSRIYPNNTVTMTKMAAEFPNLQELSLSDFMCSSQLLETLAAVSKKTGLFRKLSVKFHQDSFYVVNVSPAAWTCLLEACPGLQVFCTVPESTDMDNVLKIIKREAPLVGIDLSTEQFFDLSELQHFCLDHGSTLERLKIEDDQIPIQRRHMARLRGFPVLTVVKTCHSVVDLQHYAFIRSEDLTDLAEMKRQWKTLKVSGPVAIRDGQVVRDATSEELRQMEATMTSHLGYPWQLTSAGSAPDKDQ